MKRTVIIAVAGVIITAFMLGLWLGSRGSRRPAESAGTPWGADPVREPATPTGGAPPCVDIRNAGPLEGKSGCVAGLVLRVYTARSGNTFLDFCQDYRTCPFSSVIFAADKARFGDLTFLQGRRVEIRGDVVAYQGHAEIILHDPRQIRSGR